MRGRIRLSSFGLMVPVVALALAGAPLHAAPRVAKVDVRLALIENRLDGTRVDRCEIVTELEANRPAAFCFVYGEVQPEESRGWEGIRTRSACEPISCDAGAAGLWPMRGVPYLQVELSLMPRTGKDRVARLEASISTRKLSSFSPEGNAAYEQALDKRVLPVGDAEATFIPLLIADQKEKDSFQIRDLVLRVRARDRAQRRAAAYGEVSVVSDTPRADILLDGGVVGRTVEASPTVLRNVLVGDRDLRVRDFSGREARALVHVTEGRTADVALNLRAAALPALGNGLVPQGMNVQGYEEYWRPKDGAPVVRIPAGEFLMGSTEKEGEPSEHPQRTVYVSEFLIDKTEVSWGQYLKFANATGTRLPEPPLWGMPDDYAATAVTWDEAKAFCGWVGGRLPTEAEWEKASRGTDGCRYPWGDDWDPDRCNTRDGGPHRPEGVGVYPRCLSPYGVLDMVGSVWEYCADFYDDTYYQTAPDRDPKGPASGRLCVSRGGAWLDSFLLVRTAVRQGIEPSWRDTRHGFRCAMDAGK